MSLKGLRINSVLALLFFLVLVFFVNSQAVVSAHSGDVLIAEATVIPSINGFISPREWDDANSIDILLEYPDLWPNTTMHEATLYMKNDETYLYLAAVVLGDDHDPKFPDFGVWWFDNDHDGVIEIGDDGLVIRSDGLSTDVYRPNTIEGRFQVSDLSDGGTDDLVGAVSHTNPGGVGNYTFECRHPLDTTDNAHDFSLKPGETIGFQFQYADGSGGRGDDVAYSVVQTSDGGYALAGHTESYGAGNGDFWLVKTDSTNKAEWSRTFGGGGFDVAYSVVQTSDGGYALAGRTESYGAGNGDFWLVKTDASGNLNWSRTYGGVRNDTSSSVVQTSDGGYALAGYTDSFGAGDEDIWLVKTDSSGNVQWNKTYGGNNTDRAYSVIQTGDEGYALAGTTKSFGAGANDFWLVKTDASGNLNWSRTYGGVRNDTSSSVVQTSDEGYALAGHTDSFGAGGYDIWLVKTSPTGNIEWDEAYSDLYGEGSTDVALSMVQTSEGGYALAGYTQFFDADSYDFWLVKTNSVGEKQWDWAYAQVARAQWPGFPNYGDIVIAETPLTQHSLTIGIVGSGATYPDLGTHQYDEDTGVSVDAFPGSGWRLDHWLLDGVNVGDNSSYSVVMDGNHVLTAVFSEAEPPSISVPTWNPESPMENQEIDVRFLVFDEASDIANVTFWCRLAGGEWENMSLEIDGEVWRASISGQKEGEVVEFYIECYNDFGKNTTSEVYSFMVRGPGVRLLDVVLGVAAASGGATLGGVAVYRVFYRGRSFSSVKIEKKARQKRRKEKEEQDKERKKRELESRRGKPYLDVKVDVPSNIMGGRSYEAIVNIINRGLAPAKDVLIKVASTPGLMLGKEIEKVPELRPKEERASLIFPFKVSEQVKKGIYTLRFETKSRETQVQVNKCFLRTLRIGLLFDPNKPEYVDPLQNWLREESYTWNVVDKADDLLRLLRYDLLILAPEMEGLQEKEVHNISKFVENGQSLLAIDKIVSEEQKMLVSLLGYSSLQYESFKSMESVLTITNNQHFITRGFAVGEKIQLGNSWGNACTSKAYGEIRAVQDIKIEKNGGLITVPAIMVNRCGRGKVLHLNLHAESSLPQIENILKETIDWLLTAL